MIPTAPLTGPRTPTAAVRYRCPRCGFRFTTARMRRDEATARVARRDEQMACPECPRGRLRAVAVVEVGA